MRLYLLKAGWHRLGRKTLTCLDPEKRQAFTSRHVAQKKRLRPLFVFACTAFLLFITHESIHRALICIYLHASRRPQFPDLSLNIYGFAFASHFSSGKCSLNFFPRSPPLNLYIRCLFGKYLDFFFFKNHRRPDLGNTVVARSLVFCFFFAKNSQKGHDIWAKANF